MHLGQEPSGLAFGVGLGLGDGRSFLFAEFLGSGFRVGLGVFFGIEGFLELGLVGVCELGFGDFGVRHFLVEFLTAGVERDLGVGFGFGGGVFGSGEFGFVSGRGGRDRGHGFGFESAGVGCFFGLFLDAFLGPFFFCFEFLVQARFRLFHVPTGSEIFGLVEVLGHGLLDFFF